MNADGLLRWRASDFPKFALAEIAPPAIAVLDGRLALAARA